MNEAKKAIIKKCESIDLAKQDLNNIERFEEIYSGFKIQNIPQNFPKIIKDSEPSSIIFNADDYFDDQIFFADKNMTYFISENSFFTLSRNSQKDDSKSNNKIAKSFIGFNKEKLIENKLELKLRKTLEKKKAEYFINYKQRKRKEIHELLDINKKNRVEKRRASGKIHFSKIYNVKYNNNKEAYKKARKSGMKDIYQHLFGLNDELSLSELKRNKINNTFQRLYNQGFYTKNKSQINILKDINKIKKESKREKISENSKKILGLNKKKKAKDTKAKYDKNNIFRPIKTNMESSYVSFQFRPDLNETSKNIVKNMEKSFTRLTKPKIPKKTENKKKKISKEKYEQILNRINFLYLDGIEKMQKKKQLKMSHSSSDNSMEIKKENMNDNLNKSSLINKQNINSKNFYYNQIQWKKRLLLENQKRQKIKENINNFECTFKPKINNKSIKYLFQKTKEEMAKPKVNKSNTNSHNKSLKKINISPYRYFIIN